MKQVKKSLWRFWGSIALMVAFLLVIQSNPAMAQDNLRGSFALKGGGFESDHELRDEEYDFGNEAIGYGELSLNWLLHPTFEVGIDAGYARYLIPLDIAFRYRFNYSDNQVFVPFIAGGADFYYLRDKTAFVEFERKSTESQAVIKEKQDAIEDNTWRLGYHGSVGVQILLDYFSPVQAKEMKKNWGISNTYLNLEVKFSVVDDFGSEDVDLGGIIYTAGLLFEF